MTEETDAPVFKVWKIERLEDIATVDEWQMDKLVHFLGWAIRKCRIQKRALVSLTYHEKGSIELVSREVATGEIFYDPQRPIEEIDPLT